MPAMKMSLKHLKALSLNYLSYISQHAWVRLSNLGMLFGINIISTPVGLRIRRDSSKKISSLDCMFKYLG